MIEGLTKSDKYLYHYTSAKTALNFILKNRSLLFSRYSATNDPKETKDWQFSIGTNEHRDLSRYDMEKESELLSRNLKSHARLLCFCKDNPGLSGNHLNDIFKRGFCKPRMWAQYGERHAGVCLVFDKERLTAEIEEQLEIHHQVISGSVEYIDHPVFESLFGKNPYVINVDALEDLGREKYSKLHQEKHLQRLFFQKMTDWQNECEWRYIVFSNSKDDVYINFSKSLAGLIFGANMDDNVAREMFEVTKSLSPRCMALKWKNCSPWYDYANLRYLPGIENSPWSRM